LKFRKSITPPIDHEMMPEQNEEIVSIKGQAKSLKNRFIALEQDALKVETASSKIKYVPKRFVVCLSNSIVSEISVLPIFFS
jgi:hypothetical protein